MTGLWIAIRILENTGPTTKSTLSRSINCLALPTATSGFSSSSCTMTVVASPPSLPPACLTPEIEAVAQLSAQHRLRAGQHRHDADLELLGLGRGGEGN